MTTILDVLIRRSNLCGNPGVGWDIGIAEGRIDVISAGKLVDQSAMRRLAALST